MEKPGEITEYYFSDFYRALVVKISEDEYLVSIDVYKNRSGCILDEYSVKNTKNACIDDTCLIIEEIDPAAIVNIAEIRGLNKVFIINIKVGNSCETINVKWLVNKKPAFKDVEAMYNASWRIISR